MFNDDLKNNGEAKKNPKPTATAVYVEHHPASKYTDAMPHGIRLASAIGRALEIEGEIDADVLMAGVSSRLEDGPCRVACEFTEKGRLWTVMFQS